MKKRIEHGYGYDEVEMLHVTQMSKDLNVTVVDHPLVRHALSIMRKEGSDQVAFNNAVRSLAPLLIYAATTNLREKDVHIQTPLARITARQVKDEVVLVPILRSGLGMHEPARQIFPRARTLMVGMARDEKTAEPHWYYQLKELAALKRKRAAFLVLDPMLATGGSAIETIGQIKDVYPHGLIAMISMIAAPEGIRALNRAHPDVAITVGAVDHHLNERKYIVPGLGDAGDRQFGTT